MKNYFILIILLCSSSACSLTNENSNNETRLSRQDSILIDHFKDISLGGVYRTVGIGDFRELPVVTRRFSSNIDIYVIDSAKNDEILPIISGIIDQINLIIGKGFEFSLTTDSLSANMYIFLGRAYDYREAFNLSKNSPLNEFGSWNVWFDDNTNEITTASVLFNPWNPGAIPWSYYSLRKNFSEAIGFTGEDSENLESIFGPNNYNSGVHNFSDLDVQTMKLLYHPEMKTNLDSTEVTELLKTILLNQ